MVISVSTCILVQEELLKKRFLGSMTKMMILSARFVWNQLSKKAKLLVYSKDVIIFSVFSVSVVGELHMINALRSITTELVPSVDALLSL